MSARVREQEAVARLAAKGATFFDIDILATELDVPRAIARQLAFRMAKANHARRLKRGVYALLPPEDWSDRQGLAVSWYLTARALVGAEPYYLAYYTAMEIHQMLNHPIHTIFVAVRSHHQPIHHAPVDFRFVVMGEHRFFGLEERQVERWERITVSDLERTYIDCVDRPDRCGGLEEVFRALARRHDDIDPDRLLHYVYRFGRPATTKRLGFLLEQVGHGDPALTEALLLAAGRFKRYVPLVPGAPAPHARKDKRWEILVNADMAALRKAAIT
jgi:predicted transcriptional regulator of viral defense system